MSVGTPSGVTRRALRAVAWTVPMSLAARVVGLLGTLVLARFLSPAEYGEVAAAAILVSTASSISTFGVGIYLVTHRDLTREEMFHTSAVFLGSGALALGIAWAASGWLGPWFGAPGLVQFVPLLVLALALDRMSYVPERLVVRALRFRRLAVTRAAAEVAFTAVAVGLASQGLGAASVAWGSVARSALRFAVLVPSVPWREWLEPHRLRVGALARLVTHGVRVSATSVATFAMRRWDNLLVSRLYGPSVMGAYNYAYNLADTPAIAVGEQVTDVVGASLPHTQGAERRRVFVQACGAIALVMFPLAFGLAAVSRSVVNAFFDERWEAVGPMLAVLAVLSAARPVTDAVVAYLYACHRAGVVVWLEWGSLAAILVAISTVGRLGTLWVCVAVGGVFVLRALAALWSLRRVDGVGVGSVLAPMAGPFLGSLLMAAGVLAVRPFLGGVSAGARLAVEVGLGVMVYATAVLLLFRSAAHSILGLVRARLGLER